MLAIDTNIIVRFFVDDDPEQAGRARELILNEQIFVSTTVLLETAWVLSKAYGYSKSQLGDAFRRFGGLDQVQFEEPGLAVQAIAWTEQGMDFADALHLLKAEPCDGLATFDRAFVKQARKHGDHRVRLA